MSDIVKIEKLEKTYSNGRENLTIFKDLDFSVEEGSKTIILGQSGCGKSTLLNIIGSTDKATAGSVTCGSWKVDSLTEKQKSEYRSKFIGLIFQFHYLLPDFTALENVYIAGMMAGVPKTEAIERAKKLLEDVGLSERIDHLPGELSGGERQRVAVARALMNEPELILADEPTGNLDPENAVLISDLLFEMVDKYKKTLILVTHDMKLAEKGSCVYSVKNGTLEKLR